MGHRSSLLRALRLKTRPISPTSRHKSTKQPTVRKCKCVHPQNTLAAYIFIYIYNEYANSRNDRTRKLLDRPQKRKANHLSIFIVAHITTTFLCTFTVIRHHRIRFEISRLYIHIAAWRLVFSACVRRGEWLTDETEYICIET